MTFHLRRRSSAAVPVRSRALRSGRSNGAAAFPVALAALAALLGPPAGRLDAAPDELRLATADASRAEYERVVKPVLVDYCGKCHGPTLQEKELDLLALSPDMKASTSAARWAVVSSELSLGKMPPPGERRPDARAIEAVEHWIKAEMKRSGKHVAMRRETRNGNVVPHAALFGARAGAAGVDAPPTVRPLSPEIYDAFVQDVGKKAAVGQPFTPNPGSTFKDMGAARLDEPTVDQLLGNALAMVEQLTLHKLEDGAAKPERNAPSTLVRLFDEQRPATEAEVEKALVFLFDHALRRAPTKDELAEFSALLRRNIQDAGRKTGVRYTLAAVLLLPEALLRSERGRGPSDAGGRRRLAPREIAFALAYALGDRRPEPWLLEDAASGKLDSAEGVAAAVRRLLEDPKFPKPRVMRFFREYFDYAKAIEVFKGDEANEHYPRQLVADTDRLIEWILERDRDVIRELLATDKSFVNYRWDAKLGRGVRADNNAVHLAYGLPPDWKWTDKQPLVLPGGRRAGVLTQPAWLVAFSKSDDNDAIHRGIWVRERLLGGVIPTIPITVDAQLPIAPDRTLRDRMQVTHEAYCWSCHQQINRTGYPFEAYDHFGRFRVRESVLDLDAAKLGGTDGKPAATARRYVPVDATGSIDLVESNAVSGEVQDAVDMLRKLAASPFVEQVFVRHAFRYWTGRNETPGDARSLQAAHHAYREHGGSLQALLTSLLSSDSFLLRASVEEEDPPGASRGPPEPPTPPENP